MTAEIDKTYRKEKLLDRERKNLTNKFSIFSVTKKSTWRRLGLIILGLFVFGLIVPFIPHRYGWGKWAPAATSDEYQYSLTNFWIAFPILIIAVFAYVNIRKKIDLIFGTKLTANFKVTNVLNLGTFKILFINGWRPFIIKARQPYFKSAVQGQIISINRTWTFRLINYYIRDENTYIDEQNRKQASH